MSRSKVRAAGLLLLVFAAGVAAGVAADRAWFVDSPPAAVGQGERGASGGDGEEGRSGEGGRHGKQEKKDKPRTVIERFADELGLTPDQRAQIETILSHHRESMKEMWSEVQPRFRSLVDSARTQIEGVLTPQQVQQYRKLLRRERRRDEHRGVFPEDSQPQDPEEEGSR